MRICRSAFTTSNCDLIQRVKAVRCDVGHKQIPSAVCMAQTLSSKATLVPLPATCWVSVWIFTSGVPEPGDNICHVMPLSPCTAVWRKYDRERIHQVGLWPARYFGCYGYHFRCSGCSTSCQHRALVASGSVCVLMCVINWCGNVYLAKDCFRSAATHFSCSASPLPPFFWFPFACPSLPLTYSSPLPAVWLQEQARPACLSPAVPLSDCELCTPEAETDGIRWQGQTETKGKTLRGRQRWEKPWWWRKTQL